MPAKLVKVIKTPVPLSGPDSLSNIYKALTAKHGEGLVIHAGPYGYGLEVWTPGEKCGCFDCETEYRRVLAEDHDDWTMNFGFMILCPDCGNKRCPRATSHNNECTGSNKPGQEGSRYA